MTPRFPSAYQAGALRVELPAGDQELHRRGVVSRAETHLPVELVRFFDLCQVNFHAEARRIRDDDPATGDFQRVLR